MQNTLLTHPLQPSPQNSASLIQLLAAAGLQQYASTLETHRIDLPTLSSLSNSELRDDLMITPLAHRRAILQACATPTAPSSVPLFGSILVHLSNSRTFLSWLANSVQLIVFAFAVLRFAPQLRDATITDICAGSLVVLAIIYILYGASAYYRVTKAVERSHVYRPDWIGAGLALFLSLIAASITLSIVVLESIP